MKEYRVTFVSGVYYAVADSVLHAIADAISVAPGETIISVTQV